MMSLSSTKKTNTMYEHSVTTRYYCDFNLRIARETKKVDKPAVIFPGSKNPRRKNNRANSTLSFIAWRISWKSHSVIISIRDAPR